MTAPFQHGYLGLGANLGTRQLNLIAALKRLQLSPRFELLRSSQPYVSPAWGYASRHSFLNMVLEVRWVGQLTDLLMLCQQLETEAGRTDEPGAGYADRPLDIDLLYFHGVELATPKLTLPHPLAHRRAFVLLPLRELAPDLVLAGRTLDELIAQLPEAELRSTKSWQQIQPQA